MGKRNQINNTRKLLVDKYLELLEFINPLFGYIFRELPKARLKDRGNIAYKFWFMAQDDANNPEAINIIIDNPQWHDFVLRLIEHVFGFDRKVISQNTLDILHKNARSGIKTLNFGINTQSFYIYTAEGNTFIGPEEDPEGYSKYLASGLAAALEEYKAPDPATTEKLATKILEYVGDIAKLTRQLNELVAS